MLRFVRVILSFGPGQLAFRKPKETLARSKTSILRFMAPIKEAILGMATYIGLHEKVQHPGTFDALFRDRKTSITELVRELWTKTVNSCKLRHSC